MIKYQINKPIRIAKLYNDEFLLAIPKIQIKVQVNQNVLDFIQYLADKDQFDEKIIDKYVDENGIINKEEYQELFNMLIEEKLVI